tara:strand:+ start:607 stop:1146 length:540 start_codon:yes stop_codon:yes gene_type:complete
MEETPNLDIEELYETKQKMDVNRLNIYNKLLSKIHTKIKIASRQRNNNNFCWYLMPEILIGFPNYDISECLLYILNRLETNGFIVRYVHPNLLFITWDHYVPQYVRDEIKNKTGMSVDKFGNKLPETMKKDKLLTKSSAVSMENNKFKKKTITNNIDEYKPTGKFMYDSKLFNSISKNI